MTEQWQAGETCHTDGLSQSARPRRGGGQTDTAPPTSASLAGARQCGPPLPSVSLLPFSDATDYLALDLFTLPPMPKHNVTTATSITLCTLWSRLKRLGSHWGLKIFKFWSKQERSEPFADFTLLIFRLINREHGSMGTNLQRWRVLLRLNIAPATQPVLVGNLLQSHYCIF